MLTVFPPVLLLAGVVICTRNYDHILTILKIVHKNGSYNGITTGVLGDIIFNIVDPATGIDLLGSVVANAVLFAASGRVIIVAITMIAVIVIAFVFSFIFLLLAAVPFIISGLLILLIKRGVKISMLTPT